MIDLYCERVAAGLWAEPLNALSNLAFFMAAYALWRRDRHAGSTRILITLITLIGIGSSLFHTFATQATLLADVIPILIFQLVFLFIYARDALGFTPLKLGLAMAGFIGSIIAVGQLPADWLNGSLGYLPALMFLLLFAVLRRKMAGPNYLLLAAGLFTLSLTFRSLDNTVCEVLPIGLHYFWHMFNAAVLYLCVRAYVQDKAS